MKPWWAAFALILATLAPAQAHRLTIEWDYGGGLLQIRGWLGNDPAAGANVELSDASGRVLAEGVLDARGRFSWPLDTADTVTIDVHAGLGHRRTLTLTAADWQRDLAPAPGIASAGDPEALSGARTSGSSDAGFAPVVRVGLGLTFLLALAAAWMSYQNTRRLAEIERRLNRHESRG